MEQFGDILYQEYAKSATENQELGLAQILYESMKRNG
jgi:flagellar protein FlgJ